MIGSARSGGAADNPVAPSTIDECIGRGVRLSQSGRHDEAIECFRAAVRLDASLVAPRFNLGNALMAAGRIAEACDAYRAAVDIDPHCTIAYRNLGLALLEKDDLDAAVAALSRAEELDPADRATVSSLAIALTRSGELDAALLALERNLARAPHETRDLALKAVLLEQTGDRASVHRLLDFERFIVASTPAAVAGYADAPTFNAALEAHVLSHSSLARAPPEHATRGGLHSDDLLTDSAPVIAALEGLIQSAVQGYVETCEHPFADTAPEDVVLTAWAVVMERGGHQIPHVHPAGWLSGVYYLRVPETSSERPHEGWIEFGRPDPLLGMVAEPETRLVRPRSGSFVLFPSYVYHRTLPFETPGPRISIAFDVMPEGAVRDG